MNQNLCDKLPFGRFLAVLGKSYFGALSKQLEHLEVERYYSILIHIDNYKGKSTQQFISDELKIDKVSMVRILDYLAGKKLINKVINPDDRRSHLIQLTAKGEKMIPTIKEAIAEVNRQAMLGLSPTQQKELYTSLNQVQLNLEQLPAQKVYLSYNKVRRKHEK